MPVEYGHMHHVGNFRRPRGEAEKFEMQTTEGGAINSNNFDRNKMNFDRNKIISTEIISQNELKTEG